MRLIVNENLEFEVSGKPQISISFVSIPLKDASGLPDSITGDITIEENIVWPGAEELIDSEEAPEKVEPDTLVIYKMVAETWLRYYVENNTLTFTNTPAPVKPTEEEIKERLESNIRATRDALIAETDWTQLLDAPISDESREEVRAYRQALRDVPQQAGFPEEVIWPDKPSIIKGESDPVDTALAILVGGEE